MINNVVIIHYLAHQILTNKNSPSERNNQPRKMVTPDNQKLHNQTTQNKHYHKNKR